MDREKVIKGLEHCTSFDDGRDKFGGVGKCGGCPYYGHDCIDRMKKDALALLKEQEADMIALKNAYKELAEKGSVIVRCKDCDNRECDGRAGTIVCGITGESHIRLWFCADGERRDDDA